MRSLSPESPENDDNGNLLPDVPNQNDSDGTYMALALARARVHAELCSCVFMRVHVCCVCVYGMVALSGMPEMELFFMGLCILTNRVLLGRVDPSTMDLISDTTPRLLLNT